MFTQVSDISYQKVNIDHELPRAGISFEISKHVQLNFVIFNLSSLINKWDLGKK